MKDPKKFAKDKVSKGDYATAEIGCGTGLAGKICRHNRKKLNHFVETKKSAMKKSIDFKDTSVSVDSKDQMMAEVTTSPQLLDYLNKNIVNSAETNANGGQWKVPFPTGILTLTQREAGIYNGFFQDKNGQVVEKFDAQTVALVAKTLQIKSLVPFPEGPIATPMEQSQAAEPVKPSSDQMIDAAHDRIDMVHNRIDEMQRQVISQFKGLKIKYGDFEVEIRKSVQDFICDFKAGKTPAPDKEVVRKAISSWRKRYSQLTSDQAAAKELSENWTTHQDSFCQFVDALSRSDDE